MSPQSDFFFHMPLLSYNMRHEQPLAKVSTLNSAVFTVHTGSPKTQTENKLPSHTCTQWKVSMSASCV